MEEELLLLYALHEDENCIRRKKRKWVHEINSTRETHGEFYTLYEDLRLDEKRFYKYFRMTTSCFDETLSLIGQDIHKENTNYRSAIPSVERLAIALRFLATGDSYITIGHSFRVGFTTVGKIVTDVCDAIWTRMQPEHLPEPTAEMWENPARGFERVWKFPNCIGSIDGKHVTMKCPKKSGSKHFCYLKKFSIVLLAIVGPDYKFICVDIGSYGKNSDSGIFEQSPIGEGFEKRTLCIPVGKCLPNQTMPTPYVLIGDEAFSLRPYLMRPFPYRQTRCNHEKEKFNERLCTARRVVENAFGILVQKWRVFLRPMEVNVENAKKIVKATCVLHNYLRSKNLDEQFVDVLEPQEQNWQGALATLHVNQRRAKTEAFRIRENFVNYFASSE